MNDCMIVLACNICRIHSILKRYCRGIPEQQINHVTTLWRRRVWLPCCNILVTAGTLKLGRCPREEHVLLSNLSRYIYIYIYMTHLVKHLCFVSYEGLGTILLELRSLIVEKRSWTWFHLFIVLVAGNMKTFALATYLFTQCLIFEHCYPSYATHFLKEESLAETFLCPSL